VSSASLTKPKSSIKACCIACSWPKGGYNWWGTLVNFIKCIVLTSAFAAYLGASTVHAVPLKLAGETAAAAPNAIVETVQYIKGPRYPGDIAEFRNPRVRGAIVDVCAVWGQGCGEAGASQYCRSRNFNRALSWSTFNPGQTFVMGSDRFCTGASCRGISFVRCQ
jgi:hypothetical protein